MRNKIRIILKKLFPQLLLFRNACQYIGDYLYDFKRYLKYSTNNSSIEAIEGLIISTYHVIEKGLTMKEMRPGFGKEAIDRLLNLCDRFKNLNYPINNIHFKHAICVLVEYVELHKSLEFELNVTFKKKVEHYRNSIEIDFVEQKVTSKSEFFRSTDSNFSEFCLSRHTVRDFSDEIVPLSEIVESIELAMKSPSACNRQPSRVYIIQDKTVLEGALKIHNGNRGFGHLADKLLVITSELGVFSGTKERNEYLVDSALFTMTLVYALHHNKIGACILNWCVSKKEDLLLRRLVNIKESESITVLIAIGKVPDNFKVAISPRTAVNDILQII